MIELLVLLCVPWLWYVGGQGNKWVRTEVIPIILGIYIMLTQNVWIGLLTIGSLQIFRLGYGNYEEGEKNSWLGNLTKDTSGEYVRLLWGLIVSITGALFVAIYSQNFSGYMTYILVNCAVNYGVSKFKLQVLPCDLLVGLAVATVIFI